MSTKKTTVKPEFKTISSAVSEVKKLRAELNSQLLLNSSIITLEEENNELHHKLNYEQKKSENLVSNAMGLAKDLKQANTDNNDLHDKLYGKDIHIAVISIITALSIIANGCFLFIK